MSILLIRHFPKDTVLSQKAKRVHIIDDSIRQLAADMIDTMQDAKGVGLAAPQVGVSLRVIVVQMPKEEPVALINPEIIKKTGEHEVTEGCLSVPGYFGEVKRAASVTVKGQDCQGRQIRIKASGLLAEALEHEIDHLNGKLYIHHIESEDKLHKLEHPMVPEDLRN
jgi:peptide deformylase